MQLPALSVLSLLAAVPIASAGVLTVGPTGQFAQISDALAAAQPGDVVLVAPGTYTAFTVDQAVNVLGAGSALCTVEGQGIGVSVLGIPAGSEVVVSGFGVSTNAITAPTHASLVVTGSAGTVVLHDVVVDAPFHQTALVATGSERVVLQDFTAIAQGINTSAAPSMAVHATNSELWIVDSTISGGSSGGGFAVQGNDAVRVESGELHVWRSTLAGGDAVQGKGVFVVPIGGHGVRAIGSSVVLYGGPEGGLSGGDGKLSAFGAPGAGGAALALLGASTGTAQSSISLVGGVNGAGAPEPFVILQGGSSGAFDPFVHPTLDAPAPQAAIGASVAVGIDGHPGATAVLLAALRSGPTLSIPGIEGLVFLDATFFVQLDAELLDPTGAGGFAFVVAAIPELVGVPLHLQAVQFNGGGIALTNPVAVAVVQ